MALYLESLLSMVHFYNHIKELELSQNCAKRQVKAWGRLFSVVYFIFSWSKTNYEEFSDLKRIEKSSSKLITGFHREDIK